MQTREEFLATRKRWWEKNKDRVNAEQRRRRAEDTEYREACNAAVRAYRQEHLEEVRAAEALRRRRRDPEKQREAGRRWIERNRERIREYARAAYRRKRAEDPEALRAKWREYYRANKARINAYHVQWQRAHREQVNARQRERRSREKSDALRRHLPTHATLVRLHE